MHRRSFGNTEESLFPIGVGGFHLLEISDREALHIMNAFLDEGGNYIETAAQYGAGESERKVGLLMHSRRNECFLATKCLHRDAASVRASIDESLARLGTDHVDLLFAHCVATDEELDRILGPGGAIEAFEQAREAGKLRYIGITAHGIPARLIRALKEYPFDAVMTGFNFYDRFNYPEAEQTLIPLARERGAAVVGMKALGDGLLWEYPEMALRYALSLAIDVLPLGFNTMEMLRTDMRIVRDFAPLDEDELDRLFRHNPFLGSYVCRQCGECLPCPRSIDIPGIFLCEGWYDRQLRDGIVRSTAEYVLRDRVRFWFENMDEARGAYKGIEVQATQCNRCGECNPRCPYGIDIPAKLEYAHFKLTTENLVTIPVSG